MRVSVAPPHHWPLRCQGLRSDRPRHGRWGASSGFGTNQAADFAAEVLGEIDDKIVL